MDSYKSKTRSKYASQLFAVNDFAAEYELKLYKEHNAKPLKTEKIKSYIDSVNFFHKIWARNSIGISETLMAIYLNRANDVIGWICLSSGGISGTLCDTKMAILPAVKLLASGMIIAHNHPSGNNKPSEHDNSMTKKLKHACELLDITLLDSIIITEDKDKYYSYASEGKL